VSDGAEERAKPETTEANQGCFRTLSDFLVTLMIAPPVVPLALVWLFIVIEWKRKKGLLPPRPKAQYRRCSQCGEPVSSTWKDCPYCGRSLKPES
jgi:hypothetical protein